jgi:putative solute:sodium symporter small subunit
MNADAAGPGDEPGKGLDPAVQAAVDDAAQETAREEKAGRSLAERVDRAKAGKRERIVLAERRSSKRVVRTLAELEDQTTVGKELVRHLIRVQLVLSLRSTLLIVVVFVGIPLTFLLAPSLGTLTILGFRLPWLLLGFAVYPFFVAVAWSYNRSADRTEQEFVDWVQN